MIPRMLSPEKPPTSLEANGDCRRPRLLITTKSALVAGEGVQRRSTRRSDEAQAHFEHLTNGTSTEVRDLLRFLADGGSQGEAEKLGPAEKEFVPSECQRRSVSKYVNCISSHHGLTPLLLVVCRDRASLAQELLIWGADPNWEYTRRLYNPCRCIDDIQADKVSPLLIAVNKCTSYCSLSAGSPCACCCERISKSAGLIRVLLAGGCEVTRSVWCELCGVGFTFPTLFETLLGEKVAAISMECVAMAVQHGWSHGPELCNQPGVDIYWSAECLFSEAFFNTMASCERAHFLLKLPTTTHQQRAYKTLFCQTALLKLVSTFRSAPPHVPDEPPGHCAKAFLSVLLEEGADVYGWSLAQAKSMIAIFNCLLRESYNRESRWSAFQNSATQTNQRRHFFDTLKLREAEHVCTSWGRLCFEPDGGGNNNAGGSDQDAGDYWLLCLLPVVCRGILCRFITGGMKDDVITRALFSATRVSWLLDQTQTPHKRDDQPCKEDPSQWPDQHFPNQQQPGHSTVPMMMSDRSCMGSGSEVRSLSALCRDVILSNLGIDDVVGAVDELPLTPMLKDFLLSNK